MAGTAIEVTNTQLMSLRDRGLLIAGQVYKITDYSGSINIYMTAETASVLADESFTDNQAVKIHYVLDTGTIDYMKDTQRLIEGYFDWTSNIQGNCGEIYFENASQLIVKDSTYVICENDVGGASNVTASENIIIGDGAVVTIDSSSDITVGGGSTFTSASSSNVTVGSRNNITVTSRQALSIGDDNFEMTLSADDNIIGRNNRYTTISGENNIVKSDNFDMVVTGDLNEVSRSSNSEIGGTFNKIDKTSLVYIDNSVGNTVERSSTVRVMDTNNCKVSANDLTIDNRPAFISYQSNGNVIAVENITKPINMIADTEARTMIMDEMRFYQEVGPSGTKDNKKWVIENGVWTQVEV